MGRFLAFLLLLILPACGEMPGQSPPELAEPVVLPLERNTRELVVPARINGLGPFPLVLDSGLSGTHLLAEPVADRLGLRRSGFAVGASWGGFSLARFATVSRMDLGALTLRDTRMAVMDLPAGVTRRAGRPDIAGLLGGPLFQAYAVTVDVLAGTVTLSPPGGPAPADAEILPLSGGELPGVTLAIDGGPVILAVDTGATSDITITEEAARRLGLTARYGPGRRAEVTTAAGPLEVATLSVERVELGRLAISHVEVDVLEGSLLGGDGLPAGVDGVVGLGLLTQFRFTIDVSSGTLALVPLARHDLDFWEALKGRRAAYPP